MHTPSAPWSVKATASILPLSLLIRPLITALLLACCLCRAPLVSAQENSCQRFQPGTAAILSDTDCRQNQSLVTRAVLSGAVLFQFGSNELSAAGRDAVEKLIGDLSAFSEIQMITITGHSDTTGPAAFNLYLSENRARYISDFFKTAFPAAAINVIGKGETEPAYTEKTWAGRYRNRRVEIEVTALQ